MIKNYSKQAKALSMTLGSSMGSQEKYFEDNYWFKYNNKGYEGLSEFLVSKLLSCTNIDNYVVYENCKIDGRNGCRSENFLKPNEQFFSLDRLFTMKTGGLLQDTINTIPNVEDRIQYVINFVKTAVGLDITKYLSDILLIDAITLNNDRHFNNLGIIINEQTNEVKEAPIFDNGDALFSDYAKFNFENTFEENLEKSISFPFSANAYSQAKILPSTLKIDYEKISKILSDEPTSRAIEVLKKQLQTYEKIIPNLDKETNLLQQEQERE